MDVYEVAANKGTQWLLKQQREDGAIRSCEHGAGYYKIPYLLTISGHQRELRKLLQWIRREVFAADGDFSSVSYPRGDIYNAAYPYLNAWLICGAQKAGAFDISSRGMRFLVSQQGEEGGFYSYKNGQHSKQQDLMCTSMAGIAALYTGNIIIAKKAAAFLQIVYEAQPNPDKKLYFVYTPNGLVTNPPKGREGDFLIDFESDARQWYFLPGITAAFLLLLYKATAERALFTLAQRYLEFSFLYSDQHFWYEQIGKVGWGASMMYYLTRESRYKDLATRVADYMVNIQTDEGKWIQDPSGPDYAIIDLTAEFSIWLYEISGYLG